MNGDCARQCLSEVAGTHNRKTYRCDRDLGHTGAHRAKYRGLWLDEQEIKEK